MPGNLGLRLIQNLNEIADADLLIAHEIQEPQPGIVAERLEEPLHIESFLSRRHDNNYIRIDGCVQWKYIQFGRYVRRMSMTEQLLESVRSKYASRRREHALQQ